MTKPQSEELLLEKNISLKDKQESKHQGFVTVLFANAVSNHKNQEQWLNTKPNILRMDKIVSTQAAKELCSIAVNYLFNRTF